MNAKKVFSSMYVITILTLVLLDVILSYELGLFPTNLIFATLTTVLLDIVLQKILTKQIRFTFSAIISGLIIGSVAPLLSPFYVVVVAAVVAMLSKFFVRYKGSHIFNPAAIGLFVSLALFSLSDEWWAANGLTFSGFIVPISLLLVIPNYKAMKLKLSGSFLLTTFVLHLLLNYSTGFSLSVENLINQFSTLPFFFAFLMVSEPKTSPYGDRRQIVFGIFVALLLFLLVLFRIKYPLLLALLIGNFVYFLHKNFGKNSAVKDLTLSF